MIPMVALLLVAAACGDDDGTTIDFGGSSSTTTTTAAPTTTEAPSTTAAETTTTAPATTTTAPTTTTTAGSPDLPPGTPYSGYELVTNGTIEVEVPVEWSDIYDGPYSINEAEVGVALAASPSHEGLITAFDTPGVFIGTSTDPAITSEVVFSVKDFSGVCTDGGRDAYDDGEYIGEFHVWLDCDGLQSDFVIIVAEPYEGGAIALVEITMVTDADEEALDRILASWRLVG